MRFVGEVMRGEISIHAPRVGRDYSRCPWSDRVGTISIHAPRVGRDVVVQCKRWASAEFQSTRPVWGATCAERERGEADGFQSTRPVWGATVGRRLTKIYIAGFQSTRPVWGATRQSAAGDQTDAISIHAPRVGRDAGGAWGMDTRAYFNPRAPCGARLDNLVSLLAEAKFQSTRPVWGATTFALQNPL